MTMTRQAARHYESAVRAMSEAAAEAELVHAPVRIAYRSMAALDAILARLEELRQVPNWQDLDLTLEPGDDEAA